MAKFKLTFAETVHEQVLKIYYYLENELQSKQAAEGFLKDFSAGCEALKTAPYSKSILAVSELKKHGIRAFQMKRYVLYFSIDKEANEVRVFAVLHGLQDRNRRLREFFEGRKEDT